MRKNRIILIGIIIFIVSIIFVFCSKSDNLVEFQGETTIVTEVGDLGQVVKLISIKYDNAVYKKNIDPDTFEVNYQDLNGNNKARINKIYTSDIAEGGESDKGNYVIIEVEEFLYSNNFEIKQCKDINNSNGEFNEVKIEKDNINITKTLIVDDFKKEVFSDEDLGINLSYRLFEPEIEENKKYPLVLFLHGSGECGNDNERQLLSCRGAIVFADKYNKDKNPCYVIAPQLSMERQYEGWADTKNQQTLVDLIKEYKNNPNVDENRIYITGLSMGGIGTWSIIEDNPDLFAAAIPICGVGDISKVSKIKEMPIWAFHSENDTIVPITGIFQISYGENQEKWNGTRDVVEALKSVGSNKIKYTEYKKDSDEIKNLPMAHFSWVPTYKNQEVIDWLFEQKK